MKSVELAFDVYEFDDTQTHLNPIVMMVGIGWNKFVFRHLARDLCQATKRKVYCLDLRNHGESPSTDDLTIEVMTEDVKNFLERQNLKKVAFVTHSFSSTIAYTIALDKPESVERLLMIDYSPSNTFCDEFNRTLVYTPLMAQNRVLKTLDSKMSLKEAKAKFYNQAQKSKEGVTKHFYAKIAYDLTKVDGKFQWKKDFEYLKERHEKGYLTRKPSGFSDKEILIIRCENSDAVPDHRFQAVLKFNPNAKLLTFEKTTHLLMFEQQEKFIQAAKEFLLTSDHHTADISSHS